MAKESQDRGEQPLTDTVEVISQSLGYLLEAHVEVVQGLRTVIVFKSSLIDHLVEKERRIGQGEMKRAVISDSHGEPFAPERPVHVIPF